MIGLTCSEFPLRGGCDLSCCLTGLFLETMSSSSGLYSSSDSSDSSDSAESSEKFSAYKKKKVKTTKADLYLT